MEEKYSIEKVVWFGTNAGGKSSSLTITTFGLAVLDGTCILGCLTAAGGGGAPAAGDTSAVFVVSLVPLWLDDIERLTKEFKTHRSAFDFDRGFLGACGRNISGDT